MIHFQNPEYLDLLLHVPQSRLDPDILALPHNHETGIGYPRVVIEDANCLHAQVFFDCCGLNFRQSRIPYFDDYRRILLVTTPNWRCHYYLNGRLGPAGTLTNYIKDDQYPQKALLYISPWVFHITEAQWQQIAPGFSGPHCQTVKETVECKNESHGGESAEFYYTPTEPQGPATTIYCAVYRSISTHTYRPGSIHKLTDPNKEETKIEHFIVLESNLVQIDQDGYGKGHVRAAPPFEFLDVFGIDPKNVYRMDEIAGCFGPWIFNLECNVMRDQYEDLKRQAKEELETQLERAHIYGKVR